MSSNKKMKMLEKIGSFMVRFARDFSFFAEAFTREEIKKIMNYENKNTTDFLNSMYRFKRNMERDPSFLYVTHNKKQFFLTCEEVEEKLKLFDEYIKEFEALKTEQGLKPLIIFN